MWLKEYIKADVQNREKREEIDEIIDVFIKIM
jgi:hypothetical protein